MSRIEKKLKSTLAFTLVELLAAAALLSILAGLSFTAVVQYRKELKFMELERSAKELFLAAQNHLTLSELDGSLDRLRENAGSARLGYAGADGTYTVIVSTEETSGNAEDILGLLLPFGAIDDYVRTGGSYLIRYSLPTATVTDVFYADSLLRAPRLGYAFTGGQDLSGTGTLSQELESAKASPASDAARKMRRAFPGGNGSAMLGYYGGSADGVERQLLRTAGLRLVNGAKLYAVVEDSNAPAAGESRTAVTKLHIRGVQSGAEQILELTAEGGRRARNVFKAALDNRYLVVLDDISTGSGTDLHFASLFRGGVPGIESSAPLIPGEDIELYTEVSASGKLSNLPRSQTLTVNSLFGARRISRTADGTEALRDITVSDIRHLENLDGTISGFAPESLPAYFMKKEGGVSCVAVQQTADLSFSRFLSENAAIRREWDSSAPEDAELFGIDTAAGRRGNMQPGCFLPLNLSYRLRYDADFSGGAGESGNSSGDGGEKSYERRFYKISDVNIDMGTSRGAEKHAGLFGVVRSDCEISRLLLENFSVKAADIADAGALAGVVETGASLSVDSVLVKSYDLSDYGGTLPDGTDEASRRKRKETLEALEQREIAAADGQAGGLLGESRGALRIENSSASVYVRSERGAAGGLLGAAAGGSLTIERSYTAGHSLNGTYRDTLPGESTEPEKAQGRVNVIAPSETGGGFSGAAGGLLGAVRDVAPFRLHIVYATGSLYGGRYAGGLLGYIDPAQGGTVTNAYAAGISISRREGDGNYVGSLAAQVGDLRFDRAYGILGNTRGGTPVAPGQSGIEELSRGDIRIAGSGTAQGGGRSGNEDRLAYPYDSWLRTRYSAKYSYRTISELLDTETGSAAGSGTLPYFLRHHVGDWEAIDGESTDTLLYFDNAAILTALILQPISEDTEEEKLTLVLSDRTKEAEKERYPIEVKALGSGKPESTVHAQSGKAAPRSRAEVLITGEGEQKQRYLKLSVFLDDITTGDGHFADISSIEPGSDLVGYAYAGEKEAGEQRYERELNELERAALYQALTGEAPDSGTEAESAARLRRFFGTRKYMHKDETNSLFACSERVDRTALYERKDRPEEERIAYIASLRHLQNLDGRVSELPDGKKTWAEQIEALYAVSKDGRAGFFDEIRNRRGLTASTVLRIYAAGDGKALSAAGAFFGIRNESLHCYSGNGHTISDLRLQSAALEGAGDAAALPTEESEAMGLFRYLGDTQPKLEICNLALLDVEARGRHAGALAGLNQSSNQLLLSHVLVENPRIFAEGHAGGMVGYTYSSSNSSLRFEDCIVRSDEARSAAANAETGRMLVVSLGGTGSAEPETDDGIGAVGVSGCAGGFLGVSRGTDLHFQRCLAYGEQAIVLTLGRGGEDSAGGLVGSLVGGRNGSSGVRIRIEDGAASVYVDARNGGSAGGLAGALHVSANQKKDNASALLRCYSGGHTGEHVFQDSAAVGLSGSIEAGNPKLAALSASEIYVEKRGGYNVYGRRSSGGLLGTADGDAGMELTDCFSAGSVKSSGSTGESSSGGAVGRLGLSAGLRLRDNYVIGRIFGTGSALRGAFLGRADSALSGASRNNLCLTGISYTDQAGYVGGGIALPQSAFGKTGFQELRGKSGESLSSFTRRYENGTDYPLRNRTKLPREERGSGDLEGLESLRPDAVTRIAFYGDWEEQLRIENGNRLMLHYNAEDRESAFSIRIRGEQSGRTYYLYIDKNPQYKKCWLMDEKGERVGWASQLDTSMVQDADDPNRFRISLDNLSRRAGDFHGVTGGKFYPGENIFISVAKGSENDKVTELAYSPEERYNSLFERVEKLEDGSPNHYKAIISNSRHLENLNERGSSLNRIPPEDLAKFTVVEAEQDCDIIWSDPNWYKSPGERVRLNNKYDPYVQEMEQQKESSSIHWNSWTTVTEKGAFCPLEIDGRLARYDGKGHTIYGLEIAAYSHTGSNTALFASIQRDFVLSDLRIQNITVGSTTNAAALAATVKAGSRLTIRKVSIDNGGSALTLAADNYCGGFVGYSEGTVEITDSALHADRISIRTSKSLSAGALVGRSGLLSIENTRVTADREVQVSGIQNVGGLAGKITESAVLKNSALSAPRLRIRKESTGNSEDSAGGLLGSVSGSLRIEGCAVNSPDARVLSLAQGNAGGLVGTAANIRELLLTDSFTGAAVYTAGSWASANGGLFGSLRLNADAHRAGDSAAAPQIEKSYVSGHTVNGQYGEKTAVPEGPDAEQQGEYYGQIGRKEVGGLLGTVSGGQLELVECFSTASIYNHRAAYRSRSGGLVGEVDGTRLSIRSCYFAGKLSDNAASSQGDYKKGGILGNLSDASQLVTADGTGYLALLNPDLAGIGSLPVNDPRQLPALDAARLGDLNQDGQRSLVSSENTHPADGMLTGQAYPYEIWTGFTDETGQRIPLYYAGDWYLPAP